MAQGTEVTVAEIARWPIVGISATEARIIAFDVPPGAHVPSHQHPGWQFAYVMAGTIVSTLRGQPPQEYREGQAWYVPKEHLHVDFGNEGAEPARVLAFFLTDPNDSTFTEESQDQAPG